MFRAYVTCALLALGLFGYAQYRGWTAFESDAQEYGRRRAEEASYGTSGGTGRSGGTGGSSGHK